MPRTEIKRHPERKQPLEKAHDILNQGLLIHCAYEEEGQPYIIPFSYHFDGHSIYLHGSPKSHTLQALAAGKKVCFEVTLLEGLVYSRQAFHHSMNYQSVIGFGHGQALTDNLKKEEMFEAMLQRCYPGREAITDYQSASIAQLESTLVVEIIIDKMSVKHRTGEARGPGDDNPFAQGKAGVYEITPPLFEKPIETVKKPFWISTDRSKLQKEFILDGLKKSYWSSDISAKNLSTRIENSLCFGLYKEHTQIGFARLVTDKARSAYLADMMITPEYRGQGLGSWLVKHILKHPIMKEVKICFLSTKDGHSFYEKQGFKVHNNPEKIMIYTP